MKLDGWFSGDIVQGVHCPECGAAIVYNGNYFCSKLSAGECGWAMDDSQSQANAVIICVYLSQLLAQADISKAERKRLQFYMDSVYAW